MDAAVLNNANTNTAVDNLRFQPTPPQKRINKSRGPELIYRIEEAAADFEIVNIPLSRAIAAMIEVQTPARKAAHVRMTDERMDITRVDHPFTIIWLHTLLLSSLSHKNQRNAKAAMIMSAANGRVIIEQNPNLCHIVHVGRTAEIIFPLSTFINGTWSSACG